MEKVLQILVYFSWALWLVYSYLVLFSRKRKPDVNLLVLTFIALIALIVLLQSRMMIVFTIIALAFMLLGMFRESAKTKKQAKEPHSPLVDMESPSLFHSLTGMVLITIVVISFFFLLGKDFKSDANYFIEKYEFKIESDKKEIIIGNSKEDSDITIENNYSDNAHLRLIFNEKDFLVQNISEKRQVDLNGRYLNKLTLKPGDVIEINGKEKIKVLKINRQYPLGRSFQVSIKIPGQEKEEVVTLHTLLNKPFVIKYQAAQQISSGLNKILLPARGEKSLASIVYEPNRYFLGMNIYYIIVFFTILLLSIGIYLYLKTRFNGALLLLLMVSLPFMAGYVSFLIEMIIILVFIFFIIYIHKKRGGQTGSSKSHWNWGTVLLVISFAAISIFPVMLRMDGDFTLQFYDFSRKDAIQVTRGKETFQLDDIKKTLAYGKTHTIILGHTTYEMKVARDHLSLIPRDPEKIKISSDFKTIICDLSGVMPGYNYLYLKFPHHFDPLSAEATANKRRLSITDKKGNSIQLSKIVNKNYSQYFQGLVFFIIIPFWLFLLLVNNEKLLRGVQGGGFLEKSPPGRRRQENIFNTNNLVIYQFVYFMLGLGYVVFGALALYNNNYIENFEKYRDQAIPLFVVVFFLSLILSRTNRWLVFLYRLIIQKKFHVPLIIGMILILLVNYSKVFLYGGILYLGFVFFIRLRRDIYYEFKQSRSYPLDIKRVIEKPIASFEDKANQGLLFGLGRILNQKGWNYLLVSDLLLLLALFFIVLQIFLGGELGVAVGGFFFLPIEFGKILLTIYFADWVSRIDKGMALNVLWIYGLVLTPFILLVIFLNDFSPLLVFSFVFLYHIIKIKKNWKFKLFLGALILLTVLIVVTHVSNYTFPFRYFSIIFSILLALFLLRLWVKKSAKKLGRVVITFIIVLLLFTINYVAFFHAPSAPKSLANRIGSWLNPWQDYNLSYQYVNSLWLMKGAGTFGKSSDALTSAGYVPLIEKDLSFSLYVSVLGTLGTTFIFFTLFLVAAYVHKLVHRYGEQGRGSPFRWYLYLLEFLVVIFLAQFIVPVLYVMGLLPIMGQPLPFLSYSNNTLLLFALPFSFLMIVIGNNLGTEVEESEKIRS
ncbi:MAG: FtsW/RodA/SpoVE family cell cycle protein [Candidatus Aminicenantes bacterium]|jgi:cell division protein FtsW (lipid II flippase)